MLTRIRSVEHQARNTRNKCIQCAQSLERVHREFCESEREIERERERESARIMQHFVGTLRSKHAHTGAIVSSKTLTKVPPKISVRYFRATDNVETCSLDSGTCDAVLTKRAFGNIRAVRTGSSGMKYLACGGEDIVNLGEQHIFATDSEGNKLD